MKDKIDILLSLPKSLVEYIDDFAKDDEITRENFIEYAINYFVEECIRQYKITADAIKEARDPNAKFISHEEFKEWVDALGTENEIPMPEGKTEAERLESRAWQDKTIKERLEAIKNSNEPLISHEDVGAWIESLDTDNELPTPEGKADAERDQEI